MHASAYTDAQRFVNHYLTDRPTLRIADLGSYDVNGSLRPLFERSGWSYVGLDAVAGPNVDRVLSSEYAWPEIPEGTFDVVVTSQTLEHVRKPWKWLPEVARICAPDGLVYVCSPNTWGYHEYPVDCWRVWPEGLRALFEESGLEPLDVYANGPDTTGIGRRRAPRELLLSSSTPKITVLCVTCGRPTLQRTLDSLRRQTWGPGDEVWLVHDGSATDEIKQWWQVAELPGRMQELHEGPHGDWGHTPRNRTLPQIASGHIVNLDDDDVLAPHALDVVREQIRIHPDACFMFRQVFPDGRTPWVEPVVREGNVGTGLFVHPAGLDFGTYTNRHSGDYDFVSSTLARNPSRRLIWRPEAIQLSRPHEPWINPAYADHRAKGGIGTPASSSGWQSFVKRYFPIERILDVSLGGSSAEARSSISQENVTTLLVGHLLPDALGSTFDTIADGSYDVVTAFGVLDRVTDAAAFLAELLQIAQTAVVISTSNVWVSHCRDPQHVREYSPPALLDLAANCTCIARVDAMATPHANGEHATPLPPGLFLQSQLAVMAIILWKSDIGTRSQLSELDTSIEMPSLVGSLT